MITIDQKFESLLSEARTDSSIVGFFLGGSRGKGKDNEFSDYDVYVIVKNGKAEFYKSRYDKIADENIEIMVYSFDSFKNDYAQWGTAEEWARYNCAHIKALIDKNRKIQKIIDDKAKISTAKIRSFTAEKLDGYLNYSYRSIKCLKNRDLFAARLQAAYSILYFLDTIFALDGGRIRPYAEYLEWELKNFPLKNFPLKSKEIVKSITKILDKADLKTQQKLLKVCENIFRQEGYGKVFDGWEGKDKWAMNFKL